VTVGDYAYFATNLTVFNFAGQTIYQPTNIAYPVGSAVNPTSGSSGVSVAVQAVISADRRFVRMNLAPSLNSLASANVPLLPVTVFITPVFEGGSQGQPIPFTQFLQQPAFTSIDVQTTVSVPDGGTVLLGGLKAMAEGREEFGPPVLSQVPYINRLFKNVGIGRDTRHIMIMVTPRIIISSEEEMSQAPPQ
jgi:type II secretory pathway component GspD/PulD (secretin)